MNTEKKTERKRKRRRNESSLLSSPKPPTSPIEEEKKDGESLASKYLVTRFCQCCQSLNKMCLLCQKPDPELKFHSEAENKDENFARLHDEYGPTACVGIWSAKKNRFLSCQTVDICIDGCAVCGSDHPRSDTFRQCRFCSSKSSDLENEDPQPHPNFLALPRWGCNYCCSCCNKRIKLENEEELIAKHLKTPCKDKNREETCPYKFCKTCLQKCVYRGNLKIDPICRCCLVWKGIKPPVMDDFNLENYKVCNAEK